MGAEIALFTGALILSSKIFLGGLEQGEKIELSGEVKASRGRGRFTCSLQLLCSLAMARPLASNREKSISLWFDTHQCDLPRKVHCQVICYLWLLDVILCEVFLRLYSASTKTHVNDLYKYGRSPKNTSNVISQWLPKQSLFWGQAYYCYYCSISQWF